MSKSAESPAGLINLLDDPKVTAKRIKSAVTDAETEIRFDRETKPGISNLLTIYSVITGQSVEQLVAAYEGKMYGHLKVDLAEVVTEHLTPIRSRANELLADPAELDRLLAHGADKAREIAAATLQDVYAGKVGIPSVRRSPAKPMPANRRVGDGMSLGVILGFPPGIAEELQRWRASFGDPMASGHPGAHHARHHHRPPGLGGRAGTCPQDRPYPGAVHGHDRRHRVLPAGFPGGLHQRGRGVRGVRRTARKTADRARWHATCPSATTPM